MQLTPSPSCPAQTPLELCQFEDLVKAISGHHTIATLKFVSFKKKNSSIVFFFGRG